MLKLKRITQFAAVAFLISSLISMNFAIFMKLNAAYADYAVCAFIIFTAASHSLNKISSAVLDNRYRNYIQKSMLYHTGLCLSYTDGKRTTNFMHLDVEINEALNGRYGSSKFYREEITKDEALRLLSISSNKDTSFEKDMQYAKKFFLDYA